MDRAVGMPVHYRVYLQDSSCEDCGAIVVQPGAVLCIGACVVVRAHASLRVAVAKFPFIHALARL